MTTDQNIGPPPGSAVTQCVLLSAHQPHGAGDWQTSWWCPGVTGPQTPSPEELQAHRDAQYAEAGFPPVREAANRILDQMLSELEATAVVELTTQEQLLTALDEVLDNALHGDGCYVGPEDTVCFCVIGKVRAVLPRCQTVQDHGRLGEPGDTSYWRCQRIAHPANPDRHFFTEA